MVKPISKATSTKGSGDCSQLMAQSFLKQSIQKSIWRSHISTIESTSAQGNFRHCFSRETTMLVSGFGLGHVAFVPVIATVTVSWAFTLIVSTESEHEVF